MAVEYHGAVVVLDQGDELGEDLAERVGGVFPQVYRVCAKHAAENDDHVIAVGHHDLNVKTVIKQMHAQQAYWAVIPRTGDPVVVVSDYVSEARGFLQAGYPGFVVISGHAGTRYRRLAVVADVSSPITTGALALAATALAWRIGASMDILLLGGDPADPPNSWKDAQHLFSVQEDASALTQALEHAEKYSIATTWVPLGESPNRDQLVLDAVRERGYDLVLDDLRAIDVGPRIGRLKRVQKQLVDGDSIDTAYRLLRDAPCDVGLVVDAVTMNLIPKNYVRMGAVAALSLGMLGAASIPMATSAAAATQVQTIEAPLEPGEPEAAAAETTAATPADQAAPEQAATEAAAQPAAAAPAAAPAAPAPVGAPAPPVESLPGEVSDEEMASIEQQYSQEQQTLASEQQQLAVAQQEQAQADQSVVHAQSDILIAQHQVDSAQATLDSATAAQDYAEGRGTGLTDEEQAQAQQSVDEAEAALAQAQQDLATAQGNLAEAQEAAAAAAATTAAQQSVVDVETSNANAWTAFYQQADARHPEFVAPVEGYEISTHYGEAGSNWSSGHHTGTDFAAPAGTEVQAVADGTVIFAGTNGPYGNQVQIQHSDGTITTYSHLSEIDVSVGESVAAGDQIGLVGTTGNSTGPHLHFEVHDANGNTMDSDAWLAQHGIA